MRYHSKTPWPWRQQWTLTLLISRSRKQPAQWCQMSSKQDQVVCSQRPQEGSFSPSGGGIAAVRWRQDPITSLIHLLIFSHFFSGGVSGDRQEQMVQLHRSCGHSSTSCPTHGPHVERKESKPRVVYAVRPDHWGASWMWKVILDHFLLSQSKWLLNYCLERAINETN